jgi:DNA-binding response OmpR family regulator
VNESVLLVEDDAAIAAALCLHLEPAGFRVQHERDGLAGLAAIAQRRWDLVLLDLMLPGADGWDICRQLRQHDTAVPVIMLSARGAEAHRVLGLELGADDYLAKPFSMVELVARMRAVLRRLEQARAAAAEAPREVRFGAHVLDLRERRLRRGSTPVPLTLREFDLLAFLLRHRGRSFGRAELLRRVWGDGFDGFEHTVNSHINRLRSKIEDDPREPRLIVTVWGVGYRFEPMQE